MPFWDKRQVAPGVRLQWGTLSFPPVIGWLSMRNAIVDEAEQYYAGWLKRQQNFAEYSAHTGIEFTLSAVADPAHALQLMGAYQKAGVEHVTEDLRERIEAAARCFACMCPPTVDTPDDTAPDTEPAPPEIPRAA